MHDLFLLYLNMSLKVALTSAVIQLMKAITTTAVTCVFALNNSHNSHATDFNVMEECTLERPPPSVCVMLCHVVPCRFFGGKGALCFGAMLCCVSEILLCLSSTGLFRDTESGLCPVVCRMHYAMLDHVGMLRL